MRRSCFFVFLMILLVVILPVFQFVPNVKADPDWLIGWQYRKSHVIESASGAGTNYQMRIKVHYKMEFSFGSATNKEADHAQQGITTDGTYVYTTFDDYIYKYQKDGTLVASRNTTDDGSYGDHNGDLCYHDGKLYIVTCNYPNTPKAAAIAVYNASDLSYVGEQVLSNPPDWGAGISYHDGKFWVIFNNPSSKVIWKMTQTDTTTFTKDAEYSLTYEITGTNGYQGCDWKDDYLFCNIHGGSTPSKCDVYHWNGSGFDEHQRIDQVSWSAVGWSGTALANQGLAIENDGGTYYVWWASRGESSGNNDFAKTELQFGDSGEDVYLDSNCRTDFGDVRFTKSDGTTLIDYWMERKVDGDYAVFWVEIPDDLSSSDVTIYIYYGKSDATTTSNGANTFIVFDDFEDTDFSDWISMGASTTLSRVSLDNRYVMKVDRGTTTGSNAWRRKGSSISLTSYIIEALVKNTDTSYNTAERLAFGIDTANTRSYCVAMEGTSSFNSKRISRIWGSTGYNHFVNEGISRNKNTWYKYQVKVNGNSITFNVYDTDDTLLETCSGSDTTWSKTGYVGISIWRCYSHFDDFRVRKYVDPEPTHGSWGTEETATQTYAVELNKPFSLAFSLLHQTKFQIPLTFTPTSSFALTLQGVYNIISSFTSSTTFNLKTATNYIVAFLFQPATSFIQTLQSTFNVLSTFTLTPTFSFTALANYIIDFVFQSSVTFTELMRAVYGVLLNFAPSVTYSLNNIANYVIDFIFQPSVNFVLNIVHTISEGVTYFVDLVFTASVTFTNVLQASYTVLLEFAPSIVFDKLMQTVYHVLLSFASQVAFTLNAMAGYFADFIFHPTVTFTLDILYQAFAGIHYYVDLVFTPVITWSVQASCNIFVWFHDPNNILIAGLVIFTACFLLYEFSKWRW